MGGMMFPSVEGVRAAGQVLHRLGAVAAAVVAGAARRPRAGGGAGAGRLLRDASWAEPSGASGARGRDRRHHRRPSPHLAAQRDAVAAGPAGAPHLRRLRRHPPRLRDRGLPGRRHAERRRQVGVRAGQRGARQGGGRGRLGAIRRRCSMASRTRSPPSPISPRPVSRTRSTASLPAATRARSASSCTGTRSRSIASPPGPTS